MQNLSTYLKILGKIFVNPLKIGYLIGRSKIFGPNSKQRIWEVRTPKGCVSSNTWVLYAIPHHARWTKRTSIRRNKFKAPLEKKLKLSFELLPCGLKSLLKRKEKSLFSTANAVDLALSRVLVAFFLYEMS